MFTNKIVWSADVTPIGQGINGLGNYLVAGRDTLCNYDLYGIKKSRRSDHWRGATLWRDMELSSGGGEGSCVGPSSKLLLTFDAKNCQQSLQGHILT